MRIYTEGGERITKAMLDNLGNDPKVKEKREDPMAPINRFIAKYPDVANGDEFKNALAKFMVNKPGRFVITLFAVKWKERAIAMNGGA